MESLEQLYHKLASLPEDLDENKYGNIFREIKLFLDKNPLYINSELFEEILWELAIRTHYLPENCESYNLYFDLVLSGEINDENKVAYMEIARVTDEQKLIDKLLNLSHSQKLTSITEEDILKHIKGDSFL